MSGSKDNIYKAGKTPETSKIHKAASPQFYKAKQFLGRKMPTSFAGSSRDTTSIDRYSHCVVFTPR